MNMGASPTRTLATAAGGLVAFAGIAGMVADGASAGFDRAASLAVHQLDGPAMDALMRLFTFVGSPPVAVFAAIAVALWARRRGDFAGPRILVAATVAVEVIDVGLKLLFRRPRPQLFFEIPRPHDFSFPSGHAMGAIAIYGMCAVVIARLRPRWRVVLAIATPIAVLLIGLSRVFLGVHWPTDVLGGYAIGVVLFTIGAHRLGKNASAPTRMRSGR